MLNKIYNLSFSRLKTNHFLFYRSNYSDKNYIYRAFITQYMYIGTYNHAIVRNIDPNIVTNGLSMLPYNSLNINLNVATAQHNTLLTLMESLGITTHVLDSNGYPDSVFIEDTCVIIDQTAIITIPGALSRQGETNEVQSYLTKTFSNKLIIKNITSGTVDGGDILFTGKFILAGLSNRTSQEGINNLQQIFPKYKLIQVDLKQLTQLMKIIYPNSNYTRSDEECLHLKSFCSMCGNNQILVGGLIGKTLKYWLLHYHKYYHGTYDNDLNAILFHEDNIICIPDIKASNCLYINNTIIRLINHEISIDSQIIFEKHSYLKTIKQIQIQYNELQKVDGALTCCSLLL